MSVLERTSEIGFQAVQFTGGDPLISPLCIPAARRAHELGFESIEVYTNGLALKGEVFAALHDLGVAFAFSVYGQDPLVHDAVTRVPGSHRRTLEAIARAVEGDHRVRVGVVDTGTAGFSLAATRELIAGLGVAPDRIGVDVERAMGRGSFRPEAIAGASEGRPVREVFSGNIAINYRGEIVPCPFARELVLGHVEHDDIGDVLTAPEPVTLDAIGLVGMARSWSSSLTCWKCQVRAALLTGEECERSAA